METQSSNLEANLASEMATDVLNVLGVYSEENLTLLKNYWIERSITTRGNYYHIKRNLKNPTRGRGRPRKRLCSELSSLDVVISSRKRYVDVYDGKKN